MDDKEVGEFWRNCLETHKSGAALLAKFEDFPGVRLIRKLVEERQLQYVASGNSLEAALRDFGIDPKTWE